MTFRRTLLLAAVLGGAVPALAQLPVHTAGPRLVQLPMDPPSGMLQSMPSGALPADQVLHLTVSLPYRDQAGIEAFVDAVSDPKSPMYRHFITPAEVGARFGLPTSAVQKVVSYLTSQGMHIHLVNPSHLGILVDATVAQAEAAFHTSFQSFLTLGVNLKSRVPLYSYTATPSVPAEIQPYVSYVSGLETFTRPTPMGNFPLKPSQLQTIYNLAPVYSGGYTGKGRTIGISNFDGYRLANVEPWYQAWSLPEPSGGYGSNITVEVPSGDTSGATESPQGEGDLDIQSVTAEAPLSNVIIYDAGSGSTDLLGVLNKEESDNSADIITESYGWSGSSTFYSAAHTVHLALTAQGITYVVASGDHGCPEVVELPYSDEDPEVLVVGGLTTQTASNGGAMTSQTGWGYTSSGELDASGGGWATTSDAFNTLPSWQTGTGVPTNINHRLVPDIALNADPNTGYYIYLQSGELGTGSTGLYSGIGGTSAASPTFAGGLADCEQQLIAAGSLTANSAGKQRFGRIGTLFYSFNGNSAIFTDITSGSNGSLPNGQTGTAGTGWDFVTGWGAINFNGFVQAEKKKTLTVTVSPTTVVGGSSTAVTGTVTLPSAAPTGGAVVTLTSSSTSAKVPASITVTAGATTATFTVTTSAVTSNTSATLTAAYGGNSATATLTVTPAATITSLTLNPTSVGGGQSSTGTVTLAKAAPTGGAVVTLSSSSTAAKAPASVTVAAGATTGTFTVTTSAVTTSTTVTLTASYSGGSATATLTVTPSATITSVTLNPTSVVGGHASTGTVTLATAAPTGGLSVALTSSSSSVASVPSSVSVAAGKTTGTFTVQTAGVSSTASPTITASLSGSSKSATLTVTATTLSSVTLTPTTVTGGATINGTITLSGLAPTGGITVALSLSTTTSATLSTASAFVAANTSTAVFTITTVGVNAASSVTLTAKQGSTSKTAFFTINPPTLTGFTISPTTVVGGSSTAVIGTITLNGPAGPSGATVSLTSSKLTAAPVPGSCVIAAGKTTGTFSFTTNAVSVVTSVSVGAKFGSTLSQTLTVNP